MIRARRGRNAHHSDARSLLQATMGDIARLEQQGAQLDARISATDQELRKV